VPPRDIFMQHMAKYDSDEEGKDGTSHFGDLDNLHIVFADFHAGRFDPGDGGHGRRYLGQKIVAMTGLGTAAAHGRLSRRLEFRGDAEAPFV
jgi:hypothetical protein